MTFGFLVGSRNFCSHFWISWEVFVLHGLDCNHWVAKSRTTTAHRWLCRDSHPSLTTLWSAVINSPKFSALGTTVPVRLLQEALVIFVLKQVSQFRSFGKWEKTPCLPGNGTTFARGSIGNSWEEMGVCWCGWTFLSTRFSLKSCSHSGGSCDSSLRNSSSSSFLFVFSFSADPRDGIPRNSSLTISLLSFAGFSVLITVSCDEDVDEAGEDEVEELVDRPRTTNGT